MHRYIVLLLITGIVWAQTDFDKLVLKDGTTYLGEYSKIEGKKVYFKPQGTFAFQQVPVKQIKKLQLKDGQIINVGGKVKNSLTLEEYQKLSTKEKAIYDASAAFLYNKEKFNFPKSILTDSEKEIYKQAYSKKLKKRKFKYFLGSTIVTGAVIVGIFALNFGLDLDFGGGGGNWGMGGYSGP